MLFGVIWCHNADELANITIATNEAVHPGPRASLVVMLLVAGLPTAWQPMTLIQDKLGLVLSATWGNPDDT